MDVSTGHLTAEDVALLDGAELPFDVMTYEHGWVVSTAKLMSGPFRDSSTEALRRSGLSSEFMAAAELAGQRNCWLLRFDVDVDGDFYPDMAGGGYGVGPEDVALPAF